MFKEINIQSCDPQHLDSLWIKNRAGMHPLYLTIGADLQKYYPIRRIVDAIEESLLRTHIHPYFPYPIYLIHQDLPESNYLEVFDSLNSLPKHHQFKSKIPSGREKYFFKKISILRPLLLSISYETLFEKIYELKSLQRKYLRLLREVDYLEGVNEQIKMANRPLKGIHSRGKVSSE
ncbi:MAG: hypothetical protein HQK52_04505 [Oligoflexia bacterium]|nr:hypothetical protein [Oligoflexia bacterium]